MLIFWKQRLVFLATPKAGSTAIESALEPLASAAILRPAALKHTDIATYRRHVAPWIEARSGHRFDTVALMREPIDWLRSWYRFKLRDDHEDPQHPMNGVDFARFVADYAADGGPQRLSIGTQSGFLTDDEARVDCIFRYDAMTRFTNFLEDRLDCVIELPRINVPPAVNVALPAKDEQRLRDAMTRDLQLYDEI